MPEHLMSQLSNRYHSWTHAHPAAAAEFAEAVEDLLDDAGVVYDRVSARVKSWPSWKAKAKKKLVDSTEQGHKVDPWNEIHDLVGVRVTVYHSTVIPQVIEVLSTAFEVERSVDKAAQTRISGGFGYGSHHLILTVKPGEGAHSEPEKDTGLLDSYGSMTFELQIRTVLQHAWAEFEHDLRYKHGGTPPSPQVDRLFTLAAGLIELADQQFDDIAALMHSEPEATPSVEISAQTLPGILAMLLSDSYPQARFDRYRFLEELLEAHGIDDLNSLRDLVDPHDVARVQAAMDYDWKPGQIRLIDDLLLARYGQEHITKTAHLGNRSDRKSQLLRRLKKLS